MSDLSEHFDLSVPLVMDRALASEAFVQPIRANRAAFAVARNRRGTSFIHSQTSQRKSVQIQPGICLASYRP